jgi:hypothetical protein
MKTKIKLSFLAVLAFMTFSCTKTEDPVVSFSFEIQDETVTFTNTTVGATSYSWDFGDKTTSTEMNPVHVYASSGSFTVVLSATNDGGTVTYSETISITKPLIAIDGSFSDWSEVPSSQLYTSMISDTATMRAIQTLKVCSDPNFIYLYVKMDTVNTGSFDVFINSDNVDTTGNNSWLWAASCGADYMLDGLLSQKLADLAVYNFPATEVDQVAWAWVNTVPAGSGVTLMSTPKLVSGTVVEFEVSIIRELVANTWAPTIGVGVFVQSPTWSILGALPGGGDANTSLLKVTLNN